MPSDRERSVTFTFDDLINSFFFGILDEAGKAEPPRAEPPMNKPELVDYLERAYLARFNRRQAELPAETPLCATVLGRLAFVMFRSESADHEAYDDPIDEGEVATSLQVRHIRLAREVYGNYTNSVVKGKMRNVVHGPVAEEGESIARLRETDQPCPLCP